MKKNRKHVVAVSILMIGVWLFGGITAFAIEGENLIAAVIPQTGSLGALGYTSVGLILAGLGFLVRKKI